MRPPRGAQARKRAALMEAVYQLRLAARSASPIGRRRNRKPPANKMDRMRLDLFLKWSRVILRRSLAKDTCDAGRVVVNGQEAKAGREVRVGDVISIRFPRRKMTFRVRLIPSHAPPKETAREMLEITGSHPC